MKPFDYYGTVDVPYPVESAFRTFLVGGKGGGTLWQGKGVSLTEVQKLFPDKCIESSLDREAYDKAVVAYCDAVDKKVEEFKRDLFEEFGVTDNPKKDRCYTIAHEEGHSSGFSEVYSEFSDLVELIK
jgi:hypothetical protein